MEREGWMDVLTCVSFLWVSEGATRPIYVCVSEGATAQPAQPAPERRKTSFSDPFGWLAGMPR